MIHWTPEGYYLRVGLNLYATKWWLRLAWYWYEPATYKASGWYIRFRSSPKPHWIYKKVEPVSVIENYLFETNQMLVSGKVAREKGLL